MIKSIEKERIDNMSISYNLIYPIILFFSLIITATVEKKIIPILRGKAKQPIYEDGPSWHMEKAGTPTMGGLAFILAGAFCLVLCLVYYGYFYSNNNFLLSVIISIIFAICNGLVGAFDDFTKIKRNHNQGLTPFEKLFFQFMLATIFLMARSYLFHDQTKIDLFLFNVDLGILYYPIAVLLIVGIINFANLTDGIDGLAATVAFGIGISFFFIFHSSVPEAAILSLLIIGISLGFLIFNIHPAKIFMGDTGSLFLGALAVSCAFSGKSPTLIIPVGAVYVIEGISVILQVIVYKTTKRRLFKMAPLHHHLEKCKMSENKICIVALICTLLISVIINIL